MLDEVLKAFIIGLVEGITEWLPISSTGHMILVDEFLKLDVSDAFLAMFLVVIQIGAILAVIILYFNKLNPFSSSKTSEGKRETWRLWGMVLIGCIPAAIVGLLLDDWAEEHLFNATVVAAMLIVYGIVFIVLERRNRKREENFNATVGGKHAKLEGTGYEDGDIFRITSVDDIGPVDALKIGLFQCLAVVPGTSRSGATIIGGMLTGTSRVAAAEFTFFLAIPVMLGWGLVKAVKFVSAGLVLTQTELIVLLVGLATAFVTSVLAIKFLLAYIKRNDFAAFGWYRILVGIIVLGYFAYKGQLF
ncbi:MAG: undecaprenyl-diphosphate phosphatase [Eggerthellaceae bacterium]|nr:undecaprenyl-diphosphate phosphatase [Eggerthellaceae bacterium]